LVQATLCKTIHGSTRLITYMCGPVGPHSHNYKLCRRARNTFNRGTTPNPN